MNISLDKLAPSVAFAILGLAMLLVGATGTVPIGNPYIEIKNVIINNFLVIVGIIFIVTGPLLLIFEIRKSGGATQSRISGSMFIATKSSHKDNSSNEVGLVDPKLVHFTPPFKPNQFSIVNIPRPIPIKSAYSYKFAPSGILITNNIPFFLLPVEDNYGNSVGHLTIQVQPPPNHNATSTEKFDADFEDVSRAHFLISAGHGWRFRDGIQILHKRIGYIRFEFSDSTNQTFQLIMGKHLREWSFGNNPNLITEIDLNWAIPAWLSHDGTKRIDMLTIPIQNGPKDIRQIEIGAQFDEDPSEKLKDPPVVIISAITFERKTK